MIDQSASLIDNGRKVHLVVPGVFEGIAGESDGAVAFKPNMKVRRARQARDGELHGAPVRLIYVGEAAGYVTFRYEALETSP
jgi:hypothetical protein